jgi:ATP-dependent Clp protease ATP-binding subunit ClpA
MKPIPRAVSATRAGGHASGLARMEARRLGHHYLGGEHLLLGILVHGDNLAARVLVAHGLDLETVRAEVDRLIDQGVLPSPQPSDAELLASLGVDLEAVHARLQESFGDQAYWEAAQRVRRRPTQPVTHTPHVRTDPTPLLCVRALGFAAHEAIARDQEIGPEHLLLGLLQDAEDSVETELASQDRRRRAVLGLPDHGPNPIRLLVEASGLTLQTLRGALRGELDRSQ